MNATTDRDLYQEVTDRIIGALEQGVVPWVKPWNAPADFPRNGATGRPYSGINVLLLWLTAQTRGYASPEWFTFQQARTLGACVRKGERGTLVTFWRTLTVADADSGEDKTIPLLRHFTVFNREQIDGLPVSAASPTRSESERIEAADQIVRRSGARIIERGAVACYDIAADEIHVPPLASFADRAAFYATELHELTHWTGHPSRLARDMSGCFGSPDYAREELVAEMGSAFLCASLGIAGRLQHAEYVGHWLTILRGDKKAVFHAASQARRACEFLNGGPAWDERETGEAGNPDAALTAAEAV